MIISILIFALIISLAYNLYQDSLISDLKGGIERLNRELRSNAY